MDESQEQIDIHIDNSTDPLATADDRDEGPMHLDDPNEGNPDVDAGDDNPEQRPFTDNRAGG
jgi:hypothetical protein